MKLINATILTGLASINDSKVGTRVAILSASSAISKSHKLLVIRYDIEFLQLKLIMLVYSSDVRQFRHAFKYHSLRS